MPVHFALPGRDIGTLHIGEGLDITVSANGDLEHGPVERCEMANVGLLLELNLPTPLYPLAVVWA